MSSETSLSFELTGSIWFHSGALNWGNPRRMALLAAIHTHGSISAAARHIDLSYKAAWDAIDTMNNLASEPLVLRTTGGQRGGGASLTPKAIEILELYQQLDAAHQRFMQQLSKAQTNPDKNLAFLQTMMIQTSARNNFAGTITHIKMGAVNAEITVDIGIEQPLIASITCQSVENMELKIGSRALAFLKASAIMLGLPNANNQLSALNQLTGTIVHIEQGAVNAEVSLELSAQHRITAMISLEGVKRLHLEIGQTAVAIFDASSILLGNLE